MLTINLTIEDLISIVKSHNPTVFGKEYEIEVIDLEPAKAEPKLRRAKENEKPKPVEPSEADLQKEREAKLVAEIEQRRHNEEVQATFKRIEEHREKQKEKYGHMSSDVADWDRWEEEEEEYNKAQTDEMRLIQKYKAEGKELPFKPIYNKPWTIEGKTLTEHLEEQRKNSEERIAFTERLFALPVDFQASVAGKPMDEIERLVEAEYARIEAKANEPSKLMAQVEAVKEAVEKPKTGGMFSKVKPVEVVEDVIEKPSGVWKMPSSDSPPWANDKEVIPS